MYANRQPSHHVDTTPSKLKRRLTRGVQLGGVALLVVAIFWTGLGVGNGTISFSREHTQNKDLPSKLDYDTINYMYDKLKTKYDGKLDETKLLDGLKRGLAEAAGDPYTVYFDEKEAEDFTDKLNGTFSGVGAELGKDAQGNLIIVTPIDGTPASKAGLRPQDIVSAIDGKSTAGLEVEQAVSKIRGPKGTTVKLKIVRDKTNEQEFAITRDDIKIPSVKHEILDGNIGYLEINQFSDDTVQLAREAAQEFADKKVKGVVLDLRGNPGGLVSAAIRVSSMWLPEGKTVLEEKRGNEVISTDLANGSTILEDMPTAVLIDAGSASASEIVAGALRDHNAATLFGVKSFGKGSVQEVVKLPGGSELKVTVARWYRPNGQNIDKKGIAPDTEVKMTEDDFKNKLDPQKDAAVEFLQKR